MKVACAFVLSVMFFLFPALCPAEVFKDASEARLSNGLKVIMLENHKSPIVSFQVWYRAGARNEQNGQNRARAHARAHDVQRYGQGER